MNCLLQHAHQDEVSADDTFPIAFAIQFGYFPLAAIPNDLGLDVTTGQQAPWKSMEECTPPFLACETSAGYKARPVSAGTGQVSP